MGKKVFFLILGIMLLCGCQIKYNITITDDIKIKEKIIVDEMGTSTYYEALGYSSYNEYFNTMYNLYFNDIKNSSYIIDKNINVNTKEFSLSRESDVLSFGLDNLLKGNLFSITSIIENGNIITVNFNLPEAGMVDDIFFLGNYTINLTLPYKVTNHNASNIISSTNTYIWYFSEGQFDDIYLVFDKTKRVDGKRHANINVEIIIIVLLAIAIVIFGLIFYNKYANKFRINN